MGSEMCIRDSDPRIKARRSLFAWIEAQGRDLGRSYVSSVERYYNV